MRLLHAVKPNCKRTINTYKQQILDSKSAHKNLPTYL